jgi:hypothetical protein
MQQLLLLLLLVLTATLLLSCWELREFPFGAGRCLKLVAHQQQPPAAAAAATVVPQGLWSGCWLLAVTRYTTCYLAVITVSWSCRSLWHQLVLRRTASSSRQQRPQRRLRRLPTMMVLLVLAVVMLAAMQP